MPAAPPPSPCQVGLDLPPTPGLCSALQRVTRQTQGEVCEGPGRVLPTVPQLADHPWALQGPETVWPKDLVAAPARLLAAELLHETKHRSHAASSCARGYSLAAHHGGALPLHPTRVPGLARADYFELREARPETVRSGEKKHEVGDLPLACPAPLKLPTILKESSMQEVTKESVNFAIHRNLGEASLLVYRHLDSVMPMPPGIPVFWSAVNHESINEFAPSFQVEMFNEVKTLSNLICLISSEAIDTL